MPVTPTPVVPTPLPEAEDIVSVELPEVESTPVTEVVEVEEPELVLAPEEQEMLENAKLNVYINNLQRSIDIPDTVIESVLKGDTDALITYLIENDHAYSV